MNKSEYQNIFDNEGTHFFYHANHEIIISLIRKHFDYLNNRSTIKILDAGCGTGLLAKKLEEFGKVIGVDISKEAVGFSKKRGIDVKQGSLEKLPFRDNSFDLITSIDVLYHRSINEGKSLSELHRVLKKKGLFILRVPAHEWLYTNHDKHVYTRHRYEKKELIEKLIQHDFTIEKISYMNFPLLPLVLLNRFIEKRQKKEVTSGVQKINPLLNKFLYKILVTEKYILPHLDIPQGIGLIAVCSKLV